MTPGSVEPFLRSAHGIVGALFPDERPARAIHEDAGENRVR